MKKYFPLLIGIALIMAGLLPFDALAQDLKSQAQNASQQISIIAKLIAFLSYVVGTAFAVRALFALKGFIQNQDDNPVNRVIGFATVSSLLILLPYTINVTQEGLNLHTSTIQSASGSFLPAACTGSGLNAIFCNLAVEISPFAQLLAIIAYVSAAILTLTGLLNLKTYGDDPSQMPLRSIIMKFMLATMLISLPFAMNIFVSTVTGETVSSTKNSQVKRPMLYRSTK